MVHLLVIPKRCLGVHLATTLWAVGSVQHSRGSLNSKACPSFRQKKATAISSYGTWLTLYYIGGEGGSRHKNQPDEQPCGLQVYRNLPDRELVGQDKRPDVRISDINFLVINPGSCWLQYDREALICVGLVRPKCADIRLPYGCSFLRKTVALTAATAIGTYEFPGFTPTYREPTRREHQGVTGHLMKGCRLSPSVVDVDCTTKYLRSITQKPMYERGISGKMRESGQRYFAGNCGQLGKGIHRIEP